MNRAPPVSVVMAVHNGERFLAETLESVRNQRLCDFEFIIVDDASDDGTPALLAAAEATDSRVRLLRNERNLGLTASLNVGLRAASGKYVARIDADDICLPERFETQHAFLESNPDHIAVGCGYEVIDEAGRTVRTVGGGLDDWQVRWLGGFNPPTPHCAFFFRRTRNDGEPFLYDETYRTAQDFELWSRLSVYGKTCVLPEVLVKYRRHSRAITITKRKEQAANCARAGLDNLKRRLPPEIVEQLAPLVALFSYEARANRDTIAAAVAGCDAMLAYDLESAPTARHRRWVRRTAAGLLADAILSRAGGLQHISSTATFLYHARGYLPALLGAVVSDPMLALKSIRNVGRY